MPIGKHSRIYADLNFASSILAAYANPFDHREWLVWRDRLHPGDLFIDVGANVGVYTLLAADLGCRVIAFEPDPECLVQLRSNIRLNAFEERIIVIPKAVGSEPGQLEFITSQDSLGRFAKTAGTGTVMEVTTLDAEIDEEVAALKIDVEGAEHMVLRGASALLRSQAIAAIQVEWNQTARENFDHDRAGDAIFICEFGYETYRPDSMGVLIPSHSKEGRDLFLLPQSDKDIV